jgi:hypothetical protein
MKNLVVLATTVAIMLFACKKDDEKTVPRVDNMPLAVGNFWVYEVFNVDSDNVATSTGNFDTCRIVSNQAIDGEIYFNFDNYPTYDGSITPMQLRDSSGFLVDTHGKVFYAEADYETVFDTYTSTIPAYTLTSKMDWKDSTMTVPFGTFTQTGTMLTTSTITEPNYPWDTVRYIYTTFAKDVGIIKRRYYFFNTPNYVELRLVDFQEAQ